MVSPAELPDDYLPDHHEAGRPTQSQEAAIISGRFASAAAFTPEQADAPEAATPKPPHVVKPHDLMLAPRERALFDAMAHGTPLSRPEMLTVLQDADPSVGIDSAKNHLKSYFKKIAANRLAPCLQVTGEKAETQYSFDVQHAAEISAALYEHPAVSEMATEPIVDKPIVNIVGGDLSRLIIGNQEIPVPPHVVRVLNGIAAYGEMGIAFHELLSLKNQLKLPKSLNVHDLHQIISSTESLLEAHGAAGYLRKDKVITSPTEAALMLKVGYAPPSQGLTEAL